MSNAGNISVNLVLSGADVFLSRVNSSAKSLDQYSSATALAKKRTSSWMAETRDMTVILGQAKNAIQNVTSLFTSLPKSIIMQNAKLERSQVLIAGMDRSAGSYAEAMTNATKTVNDLVNMSSSSPFSIDAITDSFAKIQSSGIQDAALALDSLVNASAQAGANSEGLKRASVAIQQMSGKGVISMEELRQQLGEAIPTSMQIMADATGMRMAELVKKISTGTVESKTALKNFFDEMSFSSLGAAEAMSQTLEGSFNRIRNDFVKMSKQIGDGGFSSEVKDIANELDAILNSTSGARDLGYALGTVTRALFDMSVMIAENIKLLSALAVFFVGNKLVGATQNKLTSFWTEASAASNAYANNVTTYMRRTDKLIAAHQAKMVANSAAISQRYYAQSGGAISSALADYYKNYETHVNATHNLAIERIQASQVAYSSAGKRIMLTAKGIFNAMGGWTTLVVAGITAAIYAMDEFILKQQRAAESIIRNQGLGATVEDLENSKEALDKLSSQVNYFSKAISDLQKKGTISPLKESDIQLLEHYKLQLGRVQEEYNELNANIKRGQDDVISVAHESGLQSATRLIGSQMNEIQNAYNKGKEEFRKNLEASGVTGDEYNAKFTEKLEELRKVAVEQLKIQTEAQKAITQKSIDALSLKVSRNNGVYTEQDKKDLANYKGIVQGLNEIVFKQSEKIQTSEVTILNTKGNQLSTEVKIISALNKKEELYKQRLARLGTDVKYGEELLKLEEDISAGKYKNSQVDLNAARAAAKAADAAIEAYKAKQKLMADEKKHLEEIVKANDKLSSMANSMAKKLGKSQGQSLNQFMEWGEESEKNAASIAKMREQLEKLTNNNLSSDQVNGLNSLTSTAKQIDLNNIIYQQKEYQQEISRSLETSAEAYTRETAETKQNLMEVRDALVAQLAPLQQGTVEYEKTSDAIAQVDRSLSLAASKAERLDPKMDGWYELSDEITAMSDQIDNVLATAMDGVMDGFVDSMFDASASFSDTIDSMITDISKYITKLLIAQSIQAAMGMLVSSVFGGGASNTGNTSGVSDLSGFNIFPTAHAMGGVMSESGSVPLRKYAKGGIATSPQLALFGEGAHNEAYVPLPDGRSIPVTMTGGGSSASSAPVVNVINQTGTQADVESSSRFDGEKYITDVVMKAASRPGVFRNTLRGTS